MTAYQLDVHDLIAYVNGRYTNIDRTRSRGVEAEAEAALGWGLRLQATYSHDDATDESTGQQELRVPRDLASGGLYWRQGKAELAFTVRHEASDADTDLDGFSPVNRPGFTVANLAGGYDLTPHLTLTARIENLGGAHYEEAYGFGEPGRSAYVGFRFKG